MNKIRLAGWLAVGGLLGAALLAPVGSPRHRPPRVPAGDRLRTTRSSRAAPRQCDGLELGPGDVVWHFVLTSPDADSGHLTATFDKAGAKTVANGDSPADVLHFYVWTGHDTLLDAETTDVDGNNLVLSHICAGKEVESESVPVETASVPVETESVPVETESAPVETESAPVETESAPVETESAPVETATCPGRHGDADRVRADCTPATHGVPDGSVEAATGTPKEDVTPPLHSTP